MRERAWRGMPCCRILTCDPTLQWGKSVCLALGENPGRGAIHFDNILNGVITIFQIMTLEGWADLCYQVRFGKSIRYRVCVCKQTRALTCENGWQLQDSTGFWSAIYFLFLVVLGPYFAVQLFLVVLSINFNELYEPDTPAETSAPQNFVHRIKEKVKDQKDKLLNTVKPPPPSGLQRLRARLRNLAKDESFNNMVLFFIVLNTVSMATEGVCSFDTDSWCVNFKITVEMFNVLFTFVFLLEAVVKLVGLGPSEYFKARMNIFDFVIVCASMGELGTCFQLVFACLPWSFFRVSFERGCDGAVQCACIRADVRGHWCRVHLWSAGVLHGAAPGQLGNRKGACSVCVFARARASE
jgi:hypothetical protein